MSGKNQTLSRTVPVQFPLHLAAFEENTGNFYKGTWGSGLVLPRLLLPAATAPLSVLVTQQ